MLRFHLWLTAASIITAAGSGLETTFGPSVHAQSAVASGVREAYAGLPGVRIWYTDTGGRGVPVVFMHAARIKNSEFVIVPEAGHSAYWEQPEIFNRAVIDFIRKH